MKYTTITGDAIDGFECIGLFDSEESAAEFALEEYGYEKTWRVMPINFPKNKSLSDILDAQLARERTP